MKSIFHSPLKRRIFLVIVGIIIWAVISIPTTLDFIDYGRPERKSGSYDSIHDAKEVDQIFLIFRILSSDLAKRTIKVHIDAEPLGIYGNSTNSKWNRAVELQFLHKNHNIAKGTTYEPVTFDIPIETGNLMEYPFDDYTARIWFIAKDNATSEYIPVTVYSTIYNQNTQIGIKSDDEWNDLELSYIIDIKRTPMVFSFCFFISCVSWGLAIVVFNIAIDYLFYKREIPDGHLTISITMLFAMPALRKAQPEIPEIGCAIDFLCFIWCETLIGASACVILFTWLFKHNITAPPPSQV
jgi:hypothetical protein